MEISFDDVTNVPYLSENEDSLDIAARNWNRITSAANKLGYKDGREDGSESVFQEGFDKGYKEAFKVAFILGKFKSLINAMPEGIEHPRDIKEILDKTRRGACYICQLEKTTNADIEETFAHTVNAQRIHSAKVIARLHQYFQATIRQLGIDMSDLSEIENDISNLSLA